MKKLTLFVFFLITSISATVAASDIIDVPHNQAKGISCVDCHSYSAWWQFSPSSSSPAPNDHTNIVNSLCAGCHGEGGAATIVKGHSSEGLGNMHRTDLGEWETACTDCHDPHFQAQIDWLGTADDELFLVTGSIVASTLANDGVNSTFKYSSINAKAGWESPSSWTQKTGNSGRGLILLVSKERGEHTFEVVGVNEEQSEITVAGIIKNEFDGDNFGMIYGQLITSSINSHNIKFFDPNGSDFVDTQNNSGLCQVCHTRTNHFRKDSADPASDHLNATDGNGLVGAAANCVSCHIHTRGFAGGSDSGKHTDHLAGGMTCDACHQNGTPDPLTSPLCQVCHQDGRSGPPNHPEYRANWDNPDYDLTCDGCHSGRPFIDTQVMATNGHLRLVGEAWIRHYACNYCHFDTVGANGSTTTSFHLNGTIDVAVNPQWNIVGQPPPSFNPVTKSCANTYCHSNGTAISPEMREYAWNGGHEGCNACHGHDPDGNCAACHDTPVTWSAEERWMSAMPMYENSGPGTDKANSHSRHLFTGFACDKCHNLTVVGPCLSCHGEGIPEGGMGEGAHVKGEHHVDRVKTVSFSDGGTYNPATKSCSNTACHIGGTDPVWGASANSVVVCYECHVSIGDDVDDYGGFNDSRAKISMTEWETTGHGRPLAAGNYPQSNNPPANFPNNGCWYCHDPEILHKDDNNPFRLRKHQEFDLRFEKECVYCHMEGNDEECLGCHNSENSMSPQLADISSPQDHRGYVDGQTSCVVTCHVDDASRHKTGADEYLGAAPGKEDIKNNYIMMGVCLRCHDDDSGGQCTSCHAAPPDDPETPEDESKKYALGFDPKMPNATLITATSKASSIHFGHKHYDSYETNGVWKGGKFCWDCHDPHGDANIYMIHSKVSTATDGTYGKPTTQASVTFTDRTSGLGYAKNAAPFNGICNVCHSAAAGQHYTATAGDGHNAARVCTECHEHRFTDSHSSGQNCNTCHAEKPVPRHSGFGQPRECVKCHAGTIGMRMDVMGQFKANSHHVQGVEVESKHCYACHWEATSLGLINTDYHEGYNPKTYSSVKNAKVDLVIWGPGQRPAAYDNDGLNNDDTAVTFLASNLSVGLTQERQEVAKVTPHCISCHSDQNNNTVPFDDCRVPRQYAYDASSVGARYQDTGTTTWGKYTGTANAAKKNIIKSYSGHGNAVNNAGGFSATTGVDEAITNTRNGTNNVGCFDCHSSHGSKASGITSSYTTFNGTKNGANLKETQAGKGGYTMTYKATGNTNPAAVNFYNAGAGQCFDCHETQTKGAKPWGYNSTYGATAPISGYRDNPRFSGPVASRFAYRAGKSTIGGHLNAKTDLTNPAMGTINGLCTPCHDPHGVSPALGANKAYAVPMLTGTWLSSPYKEDYPNTRKGSRSYRKGDLHWNTDRNTFNNGRITEDDTKFAGLCLQCHPKSNLTDGTNKNTAFKSLDRVHETVKGWGSNAEHGFPCSKCHKPHASGLPRLMQTNCLNYTHQGPRASGGTYTNGNYGRFPRSNNTGWTCHEATSAKGGSWTDQLWNNVTPW